MNIPDNFVITLGDVFTVVGLTIALVIFVICVLTLSFFKVKALIRRRRVKKYFEKLDRDRRRRRMAKKWGVKEEK